MKPSMHSATHSATHSAMRVPMYGARHRRRAPGRRRSLVGLLAVLLLLGMPMCRALCADHVGVELAAAHASIVGDATQPGLVDAKADCHGAGSRSSATLTATVIPDPEGAGRARSQDPSAESARPDCCPADDASAAPDRSDPQPASLAALVARFDLAVPARLAVALRLTGLEHRSPGPPQRLLTLRFLE